MKAIIAMVGTTGAGKTTHGKILADRLGAKYISSGDIARSMMDQQTHKEFAEGRLSPHEDAIRGEIERLIGAHDLVVLDGFPRLDSQAQWLKGRPIPMYVVQFDWPLSVLVQRWVARIRDEHDDLKTYILRNDLYIKETENLFGEPRCLLRYEHEWPVVDVANFIHTYVCDWLISIGWTLEVQKSRKQQLIAKFLYDYHITMWRPDRLSTLATSPEDVEKKLWDIIHA